MSTDEIKKTIECLCDGLQPRRRCIKPMWRWLLWLLIVVSYTSAVAVTIGFRENILESMQKPTFIFELVLAFSIGISSSLMAFWFSIPDCEKYKQYIAIPLTLLSVQAFWMLDLAFFEGLGDFRENWFSNCWMNTLIHTALPAFAVIILVKRGATVYPCLLAIFAVIAVSEFGWVGMRLVCPRDNVGEAYILNFLPFVIIGILAGFAAKRLFKW